MVAIGLLFGDLRAEHYEDNVASDPRIDQLRAKMEVHEDLQFSKDYLDPTKRSIANSIQIFFKDGTHSEKIIVEYPIGHVRRRTEGIPLLIEKFKKNAATKLDTAAIENILTLIESKTFADMPVHEFMDLFVE
jgi:2-methylcitrate dehydratase